MKWGIISTGKIARAFAEGLKFVEGAELYAVASRTKSSAVRFAREFNITHAYESYQALASSDVDIIYIATPHNLHYENAMMCMESGKHVLCEKPFTVTARQTEHLIYTSRKKGVFLMEALWTHFLPIHETVQGWLADGKIGNILAMNFSFGYDAEYNPDSRLFNLHLAGGALYDIGIYPIAVTTHFMQAKPKAIHADGILADTGVDLNSSMILKFDNAMMTANFGFATKMQNQAVIEGEKGRIIIHPGFWQATSATLETADATRNESSEFEGPGLQFEARHAQQCVENGLLESPVMPLSETLLNMMILEEVGAKLGVKYPKSITGL